MTPKLMQLYSLRAQIEAVIALEEAELGAAMAAAPCAHPEDKRISTSTFNSEPSFRCTACGQDVKGQA